MSNGVYGADCTGRRVSIPRATPAWIGHAITVLDWDRDDYSDVLRLLADPRIETSREHPARQMALQLPSDVMPQDGFRQAGSVWCLSDERFSPCISPLAQNLTWWGQQLAAGMELSARSFCRHRGGEKENVLATILDGFNKVISSQNDGNVRAWSAGRAEWADSPGKLEAFAIWAEPDGKTILSIKEDIFNHPASWGSMLGTLMIETVETLADELHIDRPHAINVISASFRKHFNVVQLTFQREAGRHTLQ